MNEPSNSEGGAEAPQVAGEPLRNRVPVSEDQLNDYSPQDLYRLARELRD